MDYLAQAEGIKIHYNKNEIDITAPYGIYRAKNPDAKIFKRIDNIANKIGISLPSSSWNEQQIKMVNDYIEKHELRYEFRELASEFYDSYLKDLDIEIFPKMSQIAVFSLYVNSPYLAIISIQTAINNFIYNELIDFNIIKVDGIFGPISKRAVKTITWTCQTKESGLLFEMYILLEMSRQYEKLAVSNPDKYLEYLNGWNNRLNKLAKMKV